MAEYDPIKLEQQSLEAIKKHNLYFIEDVIAYVPCSKATFYNYKLETLDSIKDALAQNRINAKVSLRKKWNDSDNATLQMGLYKLIGTDKEAERLGMSVKHSGDSDNPIAAKLIVEHVHTNVPLQIDEGQPGL